MGSVTEVTVGSRVYPTVHDVQLRYGVLIVGRAIDEVSRGAPFAVPQVQTDLRQVLVKALPDGSFAIAGLAEHVFPALTTTPHTVDLTIAAPGYRPAQLQVQLPAGASLPVTAPPVELRPFPVRVQGRVIESSADATAVAGARVRIVNRPGQRHVSLRTPLRAGYPVGTLVRGRTLTPTGPARTLAQAAAEGSSELVLDDASGLGPGSILALDWERETEFVRVETVGGPTEVHVTGPLVRSYSEGVELKAVTAGPAGPPRALTRDADALDGLIQLDLVLTTRHVEIGDPATPAVEYRAVGAVTDPEGYYALDGIGGASLVDLLATRTGTPTGPKHSWALDYGRPVNVVDLQLAQ